MTLIKGTHLDVEFSRVVDGDTIRVVLPDADRDESLRILALDTEESHAGGGKPVTPWGKEAKKRAESFFRDARTVTIEFPGNEDVATALQRYRGNFGRLLVYAYRDGVDFQATMIREGFSPYFVKYGNAEFAGHHERYRKAEREAQRERRGVWDQITVNGSVIRNYAALGTWWTLRATIIDEYRRLKAADPSLLNTRLDYATLDDRARAGERATVFTEIRSIQRVDGHGGLIGIGSVEQPFSFFIPDIDSIEGEEIVNLLETRYVSGGEGRPRRGYAYATGRLSRFRDRPQMVLTSVAQITDGVPRREDVAQPASVAIASLLPNPVGPDTGFERVTLRNGGTGVADLQGWSMQDRGRNRVSLNGTINAGQEIEVKLEPGQMPLNNTGDDVLLFDPAGQVRDRVTYSAGDVVAGQPIQFG